MSGTASHSDYEYINENEIDAELKCVICRQPLQSPVSLSACNHTFCTECIKTWLARNPKCPTCRETVVPRERNCPGTARASPYVPINTRIVLNQLDCLLVRCSLCDETNIQRCHWQTHENNCIKKTVSCPSADIKCSWKGSRDTLSTHLNNCVFQQVRPIIDELKTELTSTQTVHNQLKDSVDTLERKVAFLLQFINHGNLMSANCVKSEGECKYKANDGFGNRNLQFTCSICNEAIRRDQVSFHACSGGCICCSCVFFQHPASSDRWRSSNEQYMPYEREEWD